MFQFDEAGRQTEPNLNLGQQPLQTGPRLMAEITIDPQTTVSQGDDQMLTDIDSEVVMMSIEFL